MSEQKIKKQISKISMKTIGGGASRAKEQMQRVLLATIIGKASDVGVRTSPDGSQTFEHASGVFEAENVISGEVYTSGVLYLPGGIHEMLLSRIKSEKDAAKKRGDVAFSIDFGLAVYAVPASNAAGYSYEIADYAAPTAADPLAELRVRMPSKANLAIGKRESIIDGVSVVVDVEMLKDDLSDQTPDAVPAAPTGHVEPDKRARRA